ncbi:unnamed protein product, partial [Brassica oleracea var. botrytis]
EEREEREVRSTLESGARTAPESFFVRRNGSPPLILRRPVNKRLVRPLAPPSSLTVVRLWS